MAFVIRTKNRDQLQSYLTNEGIQTLIHYPIPPHEQEAYREYNHLNFPIAEKIHNHVLSLPISPVQRIEDTKRIVTIINNYRLE